MGDSNRFRQVLVNLVGRGRRLRRRLHGAVLLWAVGLTQPALAHDFHAGALRIDHPYATPSDAGAADGAAYLRGVRNAGAQADQLMGASTPVAERVVLQRQSDGAPVTAIELAPGAETLLRHDGPYRLALIGLRQALRDGERVDLTLHFARAGEVTVKAWVQTPRTRGTPAAVRPAPHIH